VRKNIKMKDLLWSSVLLAKYITLT
jgi:hypothetical protein